MKSGNLFCCLILLSGLLGCSGGAEGPEYELAQVSGTVTMDGEPLPEVEVVFTPTGEGSLSFGTTDEEGKYELFHNVDVKGASLGPHIVSINKMGEPGTPEDTMNLIPAKYNEHSKLTADVKSGENTFDFDLTEDK